MVKCNNLSIGENLKRIRSELGLKQHEVTGGEITRNLISIIENDKTPLTEDKAKLICRNINEIMENRGLDIIIEPEDIFNPDRYDAKKQADLYIEELDKLFSAKNYNIEAEYIEEIESLLNKWNLVDKKIRIYEILGDIYDNLMDYNKGYHYYIKGWECVSNYPNRKSNYRLMLKLVANCIVTSKHEEAINLCDYAILKKKDVPKEYMGILYYNSALAYKGANLIEKCLECISESLKYIEDINHREVGKRLIFQGNCYLAIENYDEALKSYNEAVKILILGSHYDELFLAYANMAEVYIDINYKDKSIEYIYKVLNNLDKIDKSSIYLPILYSQVALVYKKLNDFNLAKKYYSESLTYARKNNQQDRIKKNILELISLRQYNLDTKKIHELFEDYRDIILNISLDNNILLILKALEFYITNKKETKALQLIKDLTINNEGGKEDEN